MVKYSNLLCWPATYLPLLVFLQGLPKPAIGKTDTLTVHFLYGSKPAKGYKQNETRWFGGIHGGHVTVQLGDYLYGFGPTGRNQVFSHRREFRSAFHKESHHSWARDTADMKYLSIKIPVSAAEHDSLQRIFNQWVKNTPYDYALFGMRCASTAYNSLSKIGLVKKRCRFGMTYAYFYPKLLRKHLIKKAKHHNWRMVFQKGRESRKWEGD